MASTASREEADDFIRRWLSDGFGYAAGAIDPGHGLAADLGVTGVHADSLLLALHERFGTDFSALDADAGFGIEDRTLSGGLYTLGSIVRHAVQPARRASRHDGDRTSDEWLGALVTVGDLVEAVHRGAWVSRSNSRWPEIHAPGGDPGKPLMQALGMLGRVSGRAFAERLRHQIVRPSPLPERARRFPESGFRREQALRCPWCERRELVVLEERFGGYDFTCLGCGKDSTMRAWSRWIHGLPTILDISPVLIPLFGLVTLIHFMGHEIIALGSLPAVIAIVSFLSSGIGQTRCLPEGATPKTSDIDDSG